MRGVKEPLKTNKNGVFNTSLAYDFTDVGPEKASDQTPSDSPVASAKCYSTDDHLHIPPTIRRSPDCATLSRSMNRGSTGSSHLSIACYSKCKGGPGSGEFTLFSSGE
jgi:hypothetical protein